MNRSRYIAPIVGLVLFFSAWEAVVRALDIQSFVLERPSRIVQYMGRFPDDYFRAALTTLQHAAFGFAIAVVVALGVGAAMASSRFIEYATQPILTLIAVTPFAAYIASVKIGLGSFSARPVVFIVALVSLPAFAFATVDGMRGADPSARELLASVDASRWEVLWRLRLPSALPSLFTAAKYNTGLALVVAYLAEVGAGGLGKIGARAVAGNQGDRLWAAILSMAILGTICLVLLNVLQRAVMGWHVSQRPQQTRPGTVHTMADLDDLRSRIDQLDGALIAIVAERLAVCRQVAAVKEGTDTPVIQPARVRDVVTTRRQQAIEAGVDPDFVEQLFRVLLTETHRIEVAGHRPDAAPEKPATTGDSHSGLDTVATRVDHLVVAVDDFELAKATLQARFGFREVPMAGAARQGICTLTAGGVTLVLVGPEASPNVAAYLERNGQGVQHVAIEVLNAGFARACLVDSGTPLLTEVLVDADGHEQFFAAVEPAAGIQLGFISRTGHRVGVGADNVLALFDSIRKTAP